jgi:hypothetical protein
MITTLLLMSALAWPDPWTKIDTGLTTALVAEQMWDIMDTRYKLEHSPLFREQNPLLGPRPSALKIYGYAALGTLAFIGISYLLPTPYREGFQFIVDWIELLVIVENAGRYPNLEVRFQF